MGADPVRTMERSPIGIPTRRAGSTGCYLQEQDRRGACNRRPDRFLSPFLHRRVSKEQARPIGDEVHRHDNKRSPGNLEDLCSVVRFPAPKIRLIVIPYPPIDPGIGEDSGTSESDTQSVQAFPVEIKILKIRFHILPRTGKQRIFRGKTRILHGKDKKGNQKEQGRNAFHGSTVMPLPRIHNRFLQGSCGRAHPGTLDESSCPPGSQEEIVMLMKEKVALEIPMGGLPGETPWRDEGRLLLLQGCRPLDGGEKERVHHRHQQRALPGSGSTPRTLDITRGERHKKKSMGTLTFRRSEAVRRTLLVAVFLVTIPVLLTGLSAAAQETIGVIRSSEGNATVTRGGQILPAAAGTKLQAGDTLRTGSDGSLGVILRDNSTLSLGPESSFVIQKFLFSPAEGKLGLMARLTKGTMAYLSGLIGKLAPESVRFETPTASIGVRGTHFAVKTGEFASQ